MVRWYTYIYIYTKYISTDVRCNTNKLAESVSGDHFYRDLVPEKAFQKSSVWFVAVFWGLSMTRRPCTSFLKRPWEVGMEDDPTQTSHGPKFDAVDFFVAAWEYYYVLREWWLTSVGVARCFWRKVICMACSNGRNFMEARSMLRIMEQAPGRHVTDFCSIVATTDNWHNHSKRERERDRGNKCAGFAFGSKTTTVATDSKKTKQS